MRILLIFLSVVCIAVMQFGSVPGGDELSYAFEGQRDGQVAAPRRVESFADIARQQWLDYQYMGNGRLILNSIVAVSSWQGLFFASRTVSVGMWFLLVYLVLKAGGRRKVTAESFLYGCLLLWWFVYYSEIGGRNLAFAVNYVWSACAMIGMFYAWRKMKSAWIVPVAFLFGSIQEVFVLPFLATTLAVAVYDRILRGRCAVDVRKCVAWVAMLAAACVLCLGPASRDRAGELLGGGVVVETLKGWGHLLLIGTPALFLALVGYVLVKGRARILADEDTRWWTAYFLFSAALYTFVCKETTFLRTATGFFVAGCVLLVRNADLFRMGKRMRSALCAAVAVWMALATALQAYFGYCSYRMVRLYREDLQGVTYMPNIWPGPFLYICESCCRYDWYLLHFMLYYGKDMQPVVLTEELYAELYLDTPAFFQRAVPLDVPGCYFDPDIPTCVIWRGEGKPTEAELARIRARLANSEERRPDWMRHLPGRVRNMFPSKSVTLAGNEASFTTKTGERVTIYTK